jgi:hypothetical protein
MLPVSVQSLQWLLLLWLVVFGFLLLYTWNARQGSVGLLLSYFCLTSLIHVPGALAHAMPHYSVDSQYLIDSGSSLYTTFLGFEQMLLGMIGFVLGPLFVTKIKGISRTASLGITSPFYQPRVSQRTFILFAIIPVFFLTTVTPLLHFIPSLNSIGTVIVMLSVVVVIIACQYAWLTSNRKSLVRWLISSTIGFPVISLSLGGFLGYGIIKALAVWMFFATIYRPRWTVVTCSFLMSYIGLSFYVGYMRDREEIRGTVWGGQSFGRRFEKIIPLFSDFTLFNPIDNEHLQYLDIRLNQNIIVGSCVDFMAKGGENFSGTSTWWVMATAWVPRILWPDKPVVAGSYGMVSRYTGMTFSEGTSVGIGHIMELYTFHGRWSVFWGMFFVGTILGWFDSRAANSLQRFDYVGFGGFFLIGSAMLDVGSNFATMIASMAASFCFLRFLIVIIRHYEPKLSTSRNSFLWACGNPSHSPDSQSFRRAKKIV